jgi:hypothetical protein
MEDPAFQAQMKSMMANPQFTKAMKHTQDALKDPKKVKELEEKAKKAIEEGNAALEEIEKQKAGEGAAGEKADGEDDSKKEAAPKDEQEEADPKEDKEEEDPIPEMPSLNLN